MRRMPMVSKFWTDQEILRVIQSNAPSHLIQTAWDTLIGKYQDALEAEALKLWGYNDFLVSDTVDRALITARTWIQAHENIDAADGDFLQWLHFILYQQFLKDSRTAVSGPNYQSPSCDDWYEQESSLSAEDWLLDHDN